MLWVFDVLDPTVAADFAINCGKPLDVPPAMLNPALFTPWSLSDLPIYSRLIYATVFARGKTGCWP